LNSPSDSRRPLAAALLLLACVRVAHAELPADRLTLRS
jgi:hypothetical protein